MRSPGKTVARGKKTGGASKSGHRSKSSKGFGRVVSHGKSKRRLGPPTRKRGGGKSTKYRRRSKSRDFDNDDPTSIFGTRKPPKYFDFGSDKFVRTWQSTKKKADKLWDNFFDKVFAKRKFYDVRPIKRDAPSSDKSKGGESKLTIDEGAKKIEAQASRFFKGVLGPKAQYEADKTRLEKTLNQCLLAAKQANSDAFKKGDMTLLEVLQKNAEMLAQCQKQYRKGLENLLKKYQEESTENGTPSYP